MGDRVLQGDVAHRPVLTGEVVEVPQEPAGGLVDLVVPAQDVDACVAAQVEALGKEAPRALAICREERPARWVPA